MHKGVGRKLKEWGHRYFWAELAGIVAAVGVSNVAKLLFGSILVAAFVATWADNLAFYGVIVWRDWKKAKDRSGWRALKLFRNLLMEFGPAEYFDSFLVRPFFLAVIPYLISNYSLAIFTGTLLVDVMYFTLAIASYEFRKKMFKD